MHCDKIKDGNILGYKNVVKRYANIFSKKRINMVKRGRTRYFKGPALLLQKMLFLNQ